MMATVRYTTVGGEIIAEKRDSFRKLYVPDVLGSTVALLDNAQVQTDTFTYWPYGETTRLSGSTPTPFQFVGTAGYYRDSSTRNYVRARVLDTQQGRWLTQDTTRSLAGDWNRYQYVGGNPSNYIDPFGLQGTKPPRKPPTPAPPKKKQPKKPCKRQCQKGALTACKVAPDIPGVRKSATFCNNHPELFPATTDNCTGCNPSKNCRPMTDNTWIELIHVGGNAPDAYNCYIQCTFTGNECDCY